MQLKGAIDLKPWETEPMLTKWYFLFIYVFTWKRAHLNSYNIMYTLLMRIKPRLRPPQENWPGKITKTLFILIWYTLRTLTSLPRQVILDSYHWSGRFSDWGDILEWKLRIANGVTWGAICFEMGPLQRRRIYRKDNNLWNFNPSKIKTLYNLAKENPKILCLEETSAFKEFFSKVIIHAEFKHVCIKNFTSIPHLTIALKLGRQNGSAMWLGCNLSTKTYPSWHSKIKILQNTNMPHTTHFTSKLLIKDDLLQHVPYIDKGNAYHEIFKLHTGPSLTGIALMDRRTQFYEADSTQNSYVMHTLDSNYKQYLAGVGVKINPHLEYWLNTTIHSPRTMELMETITRDEFTQFSAKMLVDLNPNLLEVIDLLDLNKVDTVNLV